MLDAIKCATRHWLTGKGVAVWGPKRFDAASSPAERGCGPGGDGRVPQTP